MINSILFILSNTFKALINNAAKAVLDEFTALQE